MIDDFSKKYFKLITEDYKTINLTRITNFEEFYNKQILDSVLPATTSKVMSKSIAGTKILIDIGFGGGFPLLPLAFLNKDKKFLGIECRAKKTKVVAEIALKLGLKNLEFLHSRIEDVLIDVEAVITLKAVGKVHDFLSKINSTKIVDVYFYKGPNFYEFEKEQIEKAKESWDIIDKTEIEVKGTDKRVIIGFRLKPEKVFSSQNDTSRLVKVSQLI